MCRFFATPVIDILCIVWCKIPGEPPDIFKRWCHRSSSRLMLAPDRLCDCEFVRYDYLKSCSLCQVHHLGPSWLWRFCSSWRALGTKQMGRTPPLSLLREYRLWSAFLVVVILQFLITFKSWFVEIISRYFLRSLTNTYRTHRTHTQNRQHAHAIAQYRVQWVSLENYYFWLFCGCFDFQDFLAFDFAHGVLI